MNNFVQAGLIVGFIILIILSPWLVIWSLNTLFPVLRIPYNFSTWLATLVIVGAIKSNVKVKQ